MWVHFGGVNNAFYAWLNGKMLGYSQDSCCPAEFEVTSLLQPGRNVLAVQVCPFSCPADEAQIHALLRPIRRGLHAVLAAAFTIP